MKAKYGTFRNPNPSISDKERRAIREAMFEFSRTRAGAASGERATSDIAAAD